MKTMDLSGEWKLLLDKKMEGLEKEYYNCKDFPQSIFLPGSVSQQKKSEETKERASGFLTDPYKYEGFAWFYKEITLDYEDSFDYTIFLERTRISTLWINGTKIGLNNSICGFHQYNITSALKNIYDSQEDKKNQLKLGITILIDNVNYPTKGGHMTSPDTQTNWCGITGRIELQIKDTKEIEIQDFKLQTEINPEKQVFISGKIKSFNNSNKTADDFLFKISVENIEKNNAPEACKSYESIKGSQNEKSAESVNGLNKTVLVYEKSENCAGKDDYSFNITIPLNEKIELWSDTNPCLYKLIFEVFEKASGLQVYSKSITTGFRKIETSGDKMLINGHKIFLRGKHDGLIFPMTGFAPTDLKSWLKVMKTAKNYGINHYRFHTCCPPEAAFEAADLLGIYMSPELPFWGTIQSPEEEGFNETEQNYLISEGFNILDCFGNHPSFTMMSLGNELWGNENRLEEILKGYHNYDNRHLYTSGSNNFQFWPRTTPHEDYFVGVRFSKDTLIRGSYAMCDAPLGFVQTDEPNTNHDYDVFFETSSQNENLTTNESEKSNDSNEAAEIEIQFGTGVKKVSSKTSSKNEHFLPNKPCISHEVGQYCMYPNFEENEQFKGVLKPYNFEIFKNRLEEAGMAQNSKTFFEDSSKLAVQCYKTEIEAALRSKNLSGFQLLDIQDFTGQGTAVVGVLNALMESKGIVSGEQWRSFCDETVLLASFEKYVYAQNEKFISDILLFNYSDYSYSNEEIVAYFIDTETDEILYEESFEIPNFNEKDFRGVHKIGTIEYNFEKEQKYKKIAFLLILQKPENLNAQNNLNDENQEITSILNSYMLHVYPQVEDKFVSACKQLADKDTDSIEFFGKILTKKMSIAKKAAAEGKNAIYFANEDDLKDNNIAYIPADYCTDFWCYPMFRSISEGMKKPVPVGTLGLTIQKENNLFKYFPTDSYTTPKWFKLLSKSVCVDLSNQKITPIVQMIDNFERNKKLGLLYEDETFGEKLLICTSRLYELTENVECMSFAKSLIMN